MKMSLRKVFDIVCASCSLLIIIFSFLPYEGNSYISVSLWSSDANLIGVGVTQMIVLLCVITVYLLHLFADVKERWATFANYGVGFVVLYHIVALFTIIGTTGVSTGVGFWFQFIFALGLGSCSVLWYFMSDQPFAKKETTPIVGYDPQTGKPIFAKIKGYDPKTGEPIYEK